MQTIADKQHAVELLNQLDPSQLAAVVRLLEVMVPHDEDRDTPSPAERKAIARRLTAKWRRNGVMVMYQNAC